MPVLVMLIDFYSLVILAAVILSWLSLPEDNPLVRFIRSATEPVLEPIRRLLPDLGGLDFSPMLLLLVLRFIRRALLGG